MKVPSTDSKRGRYCDDILPKFFLLYFLIVIFAALVVFGFGAIIVVSGNYASNVAAEQENVLIERFNNLPLEDRQIIIEWNNYEHDPETFLRPYEEIVAWYSPLPLPSEWNVRLILICTICILSLICVSAYVGIRDKDYWLYDLPRSPYGLVLFCAMFMGWPIFLISFLIQRYMRYVESVEGL